MLPPRKFPRLSPALGFLAGGPLSGLLLYAAFPPLDLGFLAPVALAPWLVAVCRAAGWRQVLAHSVAAGLVFNSLGFAWLRHVTWEGLVVTVLILTAYLQLFAFSARAFRRLPDLPFALATAAAWTAVEYLRSTLFFIAFPWLLLGHALYRYDAIIQVCDLGGVWLLSFLCAFLGSGLARVWLRGRGPGAMPAAGLLAAAVLAVLAPAGYGAWRLSRLDMAPGPVVGLVQGDVPQSVKHEGLSGEQIFNQHLELTQRLLAEGRVDLLLWPETMLPWLLTEDEELLSLFADMAGRSNTYLLLGGLHREPVPGAVDALGRPRYANHNSAYWITPRSGLADRYDKIRLVPVSELLPFERSFPWLHRLLASFLPPGFEPFEPGKEVKVFDIVGTGVAPEICFEISFADQSRAAAARGADVLASISNDAWFLDGVELDLARIQGKFRAVETRMAVVRAVNRGMSSVISPDGSIVDLQDARGRNKGVEGTLRQTLSLCPEAGRTLYVLVGDVIAWLCLAGAGLGLVWSLARCGAPHPR